MCVSSKSPYHKVWTEFVEGKVVWCVSTEILSEYMEILEQKTNEWFAEVIVNAIVNNENTIRVSPSFFFNLIQADPDDNKFIDCAVCGNAEYIVSNDDQKEPSPMIMSYIPVTYRGHSRCPLFMGDFNVC